jgi:syntaxin of plants SYP7
VEAGDGHPLKRMVLNLPTNSIKCFRLFSPDEDFDMQLDQIGEGIQDLAEIAQMQNEEVKRQNQMLDNVGTKIDAAHDHIENVNAKMKETLQQVRSADKVCVDIMCIVLMVGLAAVLYQIIKKNGI